MAALEIDGFGCKIAESLVVPTVMVEADEVVDLSFEVAG